MGSLSIPNRFQGRSTIKLGQSSRVDIDMKDLLSEQLLKNMSKCIRLRLEARVLGISTYMSCYYIHTTFYVSSCLPMSLATSSLRGTSNVLAD